LDKLIEEVSTYSKDQSILEGIEKLTSIEARIASPIEGISNEEMMMCLKLYYSKASCYHKYAHNNELVIYKIAAINCKKQQHY